MQLTRFTDLGLRVIIYLAADQLTDDGSRPRRRHTSSSVAKAIDASATHVAKVVSRLAEIGVIRSTRGRTGGVRLAEGGLDFRIGTLIRQLEGDSRLLDSLRAPEPHEATPPDPADGTGGSTTTPARTTGTEPAVHTVVTGPDGTPAGTGGPADPGAEPPAAWRDHCDKLSTALVEAQAAFFAALDTIRVRDIAGVRPPVTSASTPSPFRGTGPTTPVDTGR
ncbi:Rrf2 family transcriptional regulator [Corynebacterium bovis]|uniref:RrF2 family transcriptional regulator n=1 Tax=Corynebacterium bovis TaxID=36808 RepID=UPI003138CB94